MRARSVFTATTISPSPSLRQRSARYTIRARRNLPDKEFRYLRTVIVTAAIHRGLTSALQPFSLTLPLNLPALGRCQSLYRVDQTSQRPVFLLNSRLSLFTVAPRCYAHPGAPLLPKLRGHFAEFLNEGSLERLGMFSLPTCVGFRYGHPQDFARRFFLAV